MQVVRDPWKVLGLKPTQDKKQVKRAYIKKLKTTNPEDYPEEFKILRESYEIVLEGLEYGYMLEVPAEDASRQMATEILENTPSPSFNPMPENATDRETAEEPATNLSNKDKIQYEQRDTKWGAKAFQKALKKAKNKDDSAYFELIDRFATYHEKRGNVPKWLDYLVVHHLFSKSQNLISDLVLRISERLDWNYRFQSIMSELEYEESEQFFNEIGPIIYAEAYSTAEKIKEAKRKHDILTLKMTLNSLSKDKSFDNVNMRWFFGQYLALWVLNHENFPPRIGLLIGRHLGWETIPGSSFTAMQFALGERMLEWQLNLGPNYSPASKEQEILKNYGSNASSMEEKDGNSAWIFYIITIFFISIVFRCPEDRSTTPTSRVLIDPEIYKTNTPTDYEKHAIQALKRHDQRMFMVAEIILNNPDRVLRTGRTLLGEAIIHNNHEAVMYLINKGADPNAVDNFGKVSLQYAVETSQHKLVIFLLRNGAQSKKAFDHGLDEELYQQILEFGSDSSE